MKKLIIGLMLSLALVLPKAHALSFDLFFDNTPADGAVTPPIVGTGTFSFLGDPGNGSFPLLALPGYDFYFDFGAPYIFTTSNLVPIPPLASVLVNIGGGGGSPRTVTFGNTSPFGSGPPLFSSLTFVNGVGASLIFSAPLASPPNQYAVFAPGGSAGSPPVYTGNYGVPEPGSLLLLSLGLVAVIGHRAGRSKKAITA